MKKHTIALFSIWGLVACGDSATGPAPRQVTTLTLTAGPSWDPALPPEQQALQSHFAHVKGLFDAGQLLANGPLEDGRGLYLHLAEVAPPSDRILAEDPGIQSGVLALAEAGVWSLAFDSLGAATPASKVFLLDYLPGSTWEQGKPLGEQAIDAHLEYVGAKFASGMLIAGGPVSDAHGRYAVLASDKAAAEALVGDDPSVKAGLFEVSVLEWTLLQSQSAPALMN